MTRKLSLQKESSEHHAEVLMLEMDVRDDMVALLKSNLFRYVIWMGCVYTGNINWKRWLNSEQQNHISCSTFL